MPVTVNTLNHDNFRHSVNINNHELFTDLPKSLGGDDSAPSPHDYFDAALASCKALTVKLFDRGEAAADVGVYAPMVMVKQSSRIGIPRLGHQKRAPGPTQPWRHET